MRMTHKRVPAYAVVKAIVTMVKIVVGLFLLAGHVLADSSDHTYKKGEHVELWVNKVRNRVSECRFRSRLRAAVVSEFLSREIDLSRCGRPIMRV